MGLFGMSFSPSRDFELEVGKGNVANHRPVYKFGWNFAVGGAEDIWSAGGGYTGFITTASQMDVSSASANDTSAGTGARTIRIFGLNSSFRHDYEDITLNGTNTVTTTKSFFRIYRAFVLTSGSGQKNAGVITIQDASANVTAEIPVNASQTQMMIYAVEDGAKLFFDRFYATVDGTKTVTLEIKIRTNIDTTTPTTRIVYTKQAANAIDTSFEYASFVEGPADVWVAASAPSASASVTAIGIGIEVRD